MTTRCATHDEQDFQAPAFCGQGALVKEVEVMYVNSEIAHLALLLCSHRSSEQNTIQYDEDTLTFINRFVSSEAETIIDLYTIN